MRSFWQRLVALWRTVWGSAQGAGAQPARDQDGDLCSLVARAEQALGDLSTAYQSSLSRVQTLEGELTNLEKQVGHAEVQMTAAVLKHDDQLASDVSLKVQTHRRRIADLEAQLPAARAEAEAAHTEMAAAQTRLHRAKEQLHRQQVEKRRLAAVLETKESLSALESQLEEGQAEQYGLEAKADVQRIADSAQGKVDRLAGALDREAADDAVERLKRQLRPERK